MIYTDLKYQGKTPLDYQNSMKDRGVKQVFSEGGYQWEVRWAYRKGE
jgi:hypothetical protein